MVIDTSALAAIILREAEGPRLLQALTRSAVRLVSTASLLELHMVAARDSRTAEAGAEIVNTLGLIELPVTVEHGRIAREAWTRFGRGGTQPD